MADTKRVEFRSVSGITLRGNFYQAEGPKRPLVILTAGFPLLKEHYVGAFAQRFSEEGFSSLTFDYRNWGSSEGEPRQETDLLLQAEDYHDAVTAAVNLPDVDVSKIFLFGFGHAGSAAIIAAAADPRIAGLLLHSPFINGKQDSKNFGDAIYERAWRDRAERTLTGRIDPTYVRFWPESLEEARDPNAGSVLKGEGPFYFMSEALKESEAAGTPYENKITLQSVLNNARTDAKDYLYKVEKPTMYAVFPNDPFTGTSEEHRLVFETLKGNGEFKIVNQGSAATITESLLSTMDVHVEFLKRHTT